MADESILKPVDEAPRTDNEIISGCRTAVELLAVFRSGIIDIDGIAVFYGVMIRDFLIRRV